MKFQTIYSMEPRVKEPTSGISKTVPDHAMSIKQIMERHTVGMPIEQREGKFHDETGENEEIIGHETGEIMERLDFTEIQERAEALAARQEERNAIEQSEKNKKQKEKLLKALDKRIAEEKEKWKLEQEDTTKP